MPKSHLITGLDIGTSAIKILIAEKKKRESSPEIVYLSQEPSFGVRKGVVINPQKVSEIIRILLDRAEADTGRNIDSVYVNIGGSHLFCSFSRGTVSVSRADGRISQEDVNRVMEAAKTFSLPFNREILDVFPKEFIVDGQSKTKEAVGLQGVRLETEVLVVGGFTPYKKNLTQAILDADLQVLDIVPSMLSSAAAVLSPRQKELGVAVLDIGAGTSSLAVFEEENLIHLAVLPMGSANITHDIAIGLKTDIDTAEIIKIKLGSCLFRGSNKKEKIEAEGEEPLIFSQKALARIIGARVSEIFGEVKKELKKISKEGLLPAGVVLTGGGAKLSHMVELAKKELKLPCRIGKPLIFSGVEDDPSLSGLCGLILRGIDLEEGKFLTGGDFYSGIKNKIKNFFKIFIP